MPAVIDVFNWYASGGWKAYLLDPYQCTWLLAVGMLIWSVVRPHHHTRVPRPRSGTDLSMYVPVLVWGFQAVHFAGSNTALPSPMYLWARAASGLGVGVGVFSLCLLAEFLLIRRGIWKREGFPAIPLGLAAVFVAVLLFWFLILFLFASWYPPEAIPKGACTTPPRAFSGSQTRGV
jgi:hypothetical protein